MHLVSLGGSNSCRGKGLFSVISLLFVASRASLLFNGPIWAGRGSSPSAGPPEVLRLRPSAIGRTLNSMSVSLLRDNDTPISGFPKYVKAEDLGSSRGLSDWLGTRLPTQFNSWGIEPGTKNVANLWVELMDAEISIEDSFPPKRTVNVASVNIKNGLGQILIESHQEMGDGSVRARNRPLAEKMKAGESIEEACLRGIYEELGPVLGAPHNISLLLNSYRREVEERTSLSYPGLLTCYVVHTVDAIVKDLPASDFSTDEDEDERMNGAYVLSSSSSESREKPVGVKKHFWKWVPDLA